MQNCLPYLRKWNYAKNFVLLDLEIRLFETLVTEYTKAQHHDAEERTPHPNGRNNLEARIE